ncbi:MAG: hypothetical protein RLZZ234_796 [Candidatus Parcubacteria bacterium]|jgi:hypothetical protein
MFTLHRGASRTVIAVPSWGIVCKIAHIDLAEALYLLKRAKVDHDRFCLMGDRQSFRTYLKQQLFERKVEQFATLKRALFHGLVSNWRERRYYKESDGARRKLLQPTYFSLFGLLNIQKHGAPMTVNGELVYKAYFDVVGPPVNKDGHHFFCASNFHHTGEGVVFLDYGSLVTQDILTKYGEEIQRRFVPPTTHAP